MRIQSWVGAILVVVLMLCAITFAGPHDAARGSLPANIRVPSSLRGLIQRMYERSPTFRSQCDRIAAASALQMEVMIDLAIPRFCSAFTNVRRTPGVLVAEIHVKPSILLVEMLAHEFEHVLEQLDGLDMRLLARTPGSGVREVSLDIFESERAQRAGQRVAREQQMRGAAD
jgi:hypothetical protein